MAAIGKIRSWGPVLVGVIGLALFAFIAGDLWKSCEVTGNQQRQQVGEVLGVKLNYQDYLELVEEAQAVEKMNQQTDNLTEEQLNQVRDRVWNEFVRNTLVAHEAEKLGLTVTTEELQNMMTEGTHALLRNTPFTNPQTGRFDANAYKKFRDDYAAAVKQNPAAAEQNKLYVDYMNFFEKQLRSNLLQQKYWTLLAGCMLSNPVSAKMAFEGRNTETEILLAYKSYTTVNDSTVTVADADIKAKYNDRKEQYKQEIETRDIKYVAYQVVASEADRAELMKTMQEAAANFRESMAPAEVVRKAQSQTAYSGMLVKKASLPTDIAQAIDTLAEGQVTAPFETRSDNTMNVVKLMGKKEMPDSIQYRMIQVYDASLDVARNRADSIYKAINGGAPFDTIAKKYGQDNSQRWIVMSNFDREQIVNPDDKAVISTIATLAKGELKNVETTMGNFIVQVNDRKDFMTKYDVAIVKHTIDFSKHTYSEAYNNFSQYVSENKTVEGLEQNAEKYGYRVMEYPNLPSFAHNVANIRGTHDALKWIYESKEGKVSPLYECGNNDQLLVVALTKINPVGYSDWENQRDELRYLVLNDKKYEKLAADLAGVKSVEEAKAKGAAVDTIKRITFPNAVYVPSVGSDRVLSGAVAAVKQGESSKGIVKGDNGAYFFQVLNKAQKADAKFDGAQEEETLKRDAMQNVYRTYLNELYSKAKVVDNRYQFF